MNFRLLSFLAVVALLAGALTTAAAAQRRGPDLTVRALTAPRTLTPGQAIALSAEVRNTGTKAAKATTTRFVVSADAKADAKDVALATRAVKALRAVKRDAGTLRATVPTKVRAGKAFVIACADASGKVKELSERNNCKAARVTVTARKPSASAPSKSAPAAAPAAPATGAANAPGAPSSGGPATPPAEDPLPPALVAPAADPAKVAPPLPATTNTTVAAATKFLYTGADPIQKDVDAGTIKPRRVAVLRGKVTDTKGQPVPAVKVTVHEHPELGYTATRPDGGFDLAVNGGEDVTLTFERPGLIDVQRTVDATWNDFTDVPDVAMTRFDSDVTKIDADSDAPIQVASSGPVKDADGTREATLMFARGTEAEMELPGGQTKPLDDFSIRATEYTTGPNGPDAMPGDLPDTSAYTYAVEFSVDEAEKAGATHVKFDKPVATYVDDFLGFAPGTKVPAAYYDDQQAGWVPSDDGLVIKVLGTSGGTATLDVDGDGQADTGAKLDALHIDAAELQQLAKRYAAGKVLWRVEVDHFSPWDYNWPYACTDLCEPPEQPEPPAQQSPECSARGSIIGCLNQSLGEKVAINGSPLELVYSTSRAPGYKEAYSLDIPLTGASLPAGVKRVDAIVEVAGRTFAKSYDAAPNLRHLFTWDGKDAYGRTLEGAQIATVKIGYVYGATYMESRAAQQRSFGQYGISVLTRNPAREEITAWQQYKRPVGTGGAASDALGGWTIDRHHTYDPTGRMLYLGDGTKRTTGSVRSQLAPVFGGGASDDLGLVKAVASAADGTIYVAETDRNRIRRINADGTSEVVAGGGSPADGLGDGGLPKDARLSAPSGVAVGPNGTLYIADTGNGRVRRVTRGGTIQTIAGGGDSDVLGDDGPATEASLDDPRGLAVTPDGTVYVAEAGRDRVRRITPDGHIVTAAGGGDALGDGGPALEAELDLPTDVAVDAAGTLYVADTLHHRVRAVTAQGTIRTVAGTGVAGGTGDGGAATSARLSSPQGIAVDADGTLFIADRARHAVRRVSATGHISRLAGTGESGLSGDGGAPGNAQLSFPQDVAVEPAGSVLVADAANHRVRRIVKGLPGFADAEIAVPSAGGGEVYLFDSAGKHLKTVNALTSATIDAFAYDEAGRLKTITDRDGLTTRIERSGDGTPTAIVAPNGRVTQLEVEGGRLTAIVDPTHHATRLTYHPGGLLKSFERPGGGVSTFTYDDRGRLKQDVGPDGRSSTLSVTPIRRGNVVTVETTLGRKTVYRTEVGDDGISRRTVTEPGGATTTAYTTEDGESVTVTPDGTKRTTRLAPDPRWGMTAPYAGRVTTQTPGGRTRTVTKTRTVDLADPLNVFSVEKLTERTSVAGRTSTATITPPAQGSDEWVARATTPTGRESVRVFDAAGHVLRDQVKGREATRYAYDDRGRLRSVKRGTGAAERSATLAFNDRDEVEGITNPLADSAAFTYDDGGRPKTRTAFDGTSVTEYGHNADGRMTSLKAPGRTAFTRDIGADGLLHGQTAPLVAPQANTTSFTYDKDGRVQTMDLPGGRRVTHDYDEQSGHETDVKLARGTIHSTVEHATGRVTRIEAPGGVDLDIDYDGQVALGWTWSGPVAGSVERTVDDELGTAEQTVNGADPITYGHDGDGMVNRIGAETIGYSPDNGALTSLTVGGLTETWNHDTFGATESMTTKRGGQTVFGLAFERDDADRVTQKTETIGGETHVFDYAYDKLGRLQRVERDGTVIADPEYDANGNRTDGATEHDAQDRVTKRGATSYGYNAEGQRTSATGPGGTTSYAYDELGNLLGVDLPSGRKVEYLVDGQNRRVGKKVDGQLVQGLLWEGRLRPAAQLDASGDVVSRFVYGGRGNVPDYMVRGGRTYRLIGDLVGSVRLVVDVASGEVAQRIDYDPWGRVTADTNPGFQPFGFGGGLYDHETGLVRFGQRDYDAVTGRWMLKDPAGYSAGDTNLYAYAANDPVDNGDQDGQIMIPYRTPWGIMDLLRERTKELWPDTVDKDGNTVTNMDRWNGPGDAWRHCAGSCETARQYGETIAAAAGEFHEIDGDIRQNQETGEHEMDDFNNACGREIGSTAESLQDCEDRCLDALKNGELKTYEQGSTPTFREEVRQTLQDLTADLDAAMNFPLIGGMGEN